MNKKKWKQKVLIFMLAMLLGTGAGGAYGINYSVNAGCAPESYSALGFTTFGTVTDSTNASLAVGNDVQYINAAGNYITQDATGGPGAGETLARTWLVGDDADKYNLFSNTAGKFYHGITGLTEVNYFYVRAWDGDPDAPDSKFGESQMFQANTDPNVPPVPNDIGLPDFKAMFPKSAPLTPTGLTVESITYNSGLAVFNASFGARYYQISWGTDANAQGTGLSPQSYNTQHYPSPNTTDLKSINSMTGLSDDTDYWVKVKAGNAFGESGWSESVKFHTLRLPDNYPPQTIADLRIVGTAESSGTFSVTLDWTAPYDTDRLQNHVNVSGYEIRYSTRPILGATLESFEDWTLATLFEAAPAPLDFGTTQEVTIPGLDAGLYFFAIKSKDDNQPAPNWSDISNLTGTVLGAMGGGGFSGPTTIETGWNLIASGQPSPMTLEASNFKEAGGHSGNQLTGDLICQQIPGTINYNIAYLSQTGWIDVNTGASPTWEIEPDRGYFYRNRNGSFPWGERPKK